MIISVASGKGGTGKTTIATSLALSLGAGVRLLDCDVEEPNAHLFIHPKFHTKKSITVPVPMVDEKKCTRCGKCSEICRFKAVIVIGETILTFPELCHGCGGCLEICPEKAVVETTREVGIIERGFRNGIEFGHGRLRVGEALSPPLIREVRAMAQTDKPTIVDAPPGTSCPMISSIKGTDFVLLVTEPTPFGLHDLVLAKEAVDILNIPTGLVINRADMGDRRVHEYAEEMNLPLLMEIPFDRSIAEAYSRGSTIVEAKPEWQQRFVHLYQRIESMIHKTESSL